MVESTQNKAQGAASEVDGEVHPILKNAQEGGGGKGVAVWTGRCVCCAGSVGAHAGGVLGPVQCHKV